MMDQLRQDAASAMRAMAKDRGLTLVAVLTLALGIGANTAVFSLTDQILLRRLPVQDPESLVVLRMPGPKSGKLWSDIDNGAQSFSYPFYKDIRDRNEVFSGTLARFATSMSVAGQGQTEKADGELVSGNYFEVLGVRPALGRVVSRDDEGAPGTGAVVVLSHGYWTRRFAASPAILNQKLLVNGHPMTVVGVTQKGFNGIQVGQMPDLFVPISMQPQMMPNWDALNGRRDYWLQMMARLKPGLTREQAEAGLQPAVRGILEQEVTLNKGWNADARKRFLDKKLLLIPGEQGRQVAQEDSADGLVLLSGIVGLVLLIACANVANLLIARGVARQREFAVRLALGAQRTHLLRQQLTESLLLSLAGGIAGLVMAAWLIDALLATLPAEAGMTGLSSELSGRLMVFNFGIALATGALFGVLPALRATRPDILNSLKEQGAGTGTSREHVRLRKSLVVAQIALTAVLLMTAGLFLRSLGELRHVDLGMRIDSLYTFSVEPALISYSPEQTVAFIEETRRDLDALPGVTMSSAARMAVLTDNNAGSNITIEGFTPPDEDGVQTLQNWIAPRYFATMGIPLVSGREFTEADNSKAPLVGIINETMARKYFAGRNPIGMRFAFGSGNAVKPNIEIVGVVRNSKHSDVKQEEREFVYVPFAQSKGIGEATFYVRYSGSAAAIANGVRETVGRREANLPLFAMKTMEKQVDESLAGERLLSVLSSSFGFVAALLAALGLYGIMAYSVARRTREIGIRMALGASTNNVRGLVLREAAVMGAIGLAIGIPAALGAGRLARSLLYQVSPSDAAMLVGSSLLLVGVVLLASYVPARRATKVDPVVALRYE